MGRLTKVRKLMGKFPGQTAKKQRKMLREILQLCGKNVGVNLGKRGFCGSSLLCNATVLTGSVLVIAGATTIIALAATGQFDPTEAMGTEGDSPEGDEEVID